MGFGVDSNSDGVWILIFCYGFLFLDSDGWILDSDGVWVGFGLVGLVWRSGGGGMVVTVVGGVWLSWVTVVGLFGRHWSWWDYYCYVLCSLCWFDLK